MQDTTYRVTGMSCDHCVAAIRQEVGSIASVREIDVDLGAGTVRVRSDEPLDVEAVSAAVDEAGFELVTS